MAFRPLLLLLACASALAHPMLYKLNPEEKYEADLVPVSSTVIPLTVLEVSYGAGGKPSEEYKAAYLRKLRKQVLQRADKDKQNDEDDEAPTVLGLSDSLLSPAPSDADALITVKSQLEKAKVKAV
ncbi:uncharacterized protein LOC128265153 [Drosophila gunungcola]|uniref:Uncharacterized protein n=1 Tax=Drosophila gunungcola TaxID=103775 RepID=A0A9P9YBC9_9MUSC|nr:uncharacterized protein LOC128265153 [Drosophila gunungcola]KAI8033821.1 hypothetical protein M5D96_013405 [Drosophila gunungcola]